MPKLGWHYVVNLTPHPIVLRGPLGDQMILPDGDVARVSEERRVIEEDCWLGLFVGRLTEVRVGAIEGLPDPEPGTVYVVSRAVAEAARGRPDVLAPDTGGSAIRDDSGRIVAVTGFVRFST